MVMVRKKILIRLVLEVPQRRQLQTDALRWEMELAAQSDLTIISRAGRKKIHISYFHNVYAIKSMLECFRPHILVLDALTSVHQSLTNFT